MFKKASVLILTFTWLLSLFACGSGKRQTAYVITPLNNGAAAFRVDTNTGRLSQILGSPYPTGISPSAIRVHPSGKFAYVSNAGENTISLFKIGSTGELTEVRPRTLTGQQPADVVMDPAGKFLFAINTADNDITAYSISASGGALQATSAPPVQTSGFTPIRGAITPSGKFLYVANSGSATVSGFAIDTSGGLSPVPHSPIAAGDGPNWIAIDSAGKFLYVANLLDGTFSGYSIDGTTGELTGMSGSPFGVAPSGTTIVPVTSILVDASGKYLYVSTLGSGSNVYGYTVDGTSGVPTGPVTSSPFQAGNGAIFIVTDTTGSLVFVGNQTSNTVSGFKITPSTGLLTLISTTNTVSAPTSMVLVK